MSGALPFSPWVPDDSASQASARLLAKRILNETIVSASPRILDVGCGVGDSQGDLLAYRADAQWYGLDIMTSQEASQRAGAPLRMAYYDGTAFPYKTGVFDLVYSRQVFEHVVEPGRVMAEIGRVLRPGGVLTLSTSFLEPYHSESVWGFSPLGLIRLTTGAGLDVTEIRPGVDGLTLLLRRLLGRPACFTRWFERESPLNRLIGLAGRLRGRDPRAINIQKLQICGHICLVARKPAGSGSGDGAGPGDTEGR